MSTLSAAQLRQFVVSVENSATIDWGYICKNLSDSASHHLVIYVSARKQAAAPAMLTGGLLPPLPAGEGIVRTINDEPAQPAAEEAGQPDDARTGVLASPFSVSGSDVACCQVCVVSEPGVL